MKKTQNNNEAASGGALYVALRSAENLARQIEALLVEEQCETYCRHSEERDRLLVSELTKLGKTTIEIAAFLRWHEGYIKRLLPPVVEATEPTTHRRRTCWHGCGAWIEYAPTAKAPNGAWVDVGTQTHHRCSKKGEKAA